MTMPANLLPPGRQQFFDANGDPLVGGQLYFYEPGTEVPKTTWTAPDQEVPNTNPVILDDLGSASVYGQGSYREILMDASGNTLWDEVVDSGVNSAGDEAQGGGGVNGSGTDGSTSSTASVGLYITRVPVAESIAAGAPVNIFSSGGALAVRNANGSATTPRACHGFAATTGIPEGVMTVYVDGIVGGLSGITPGQDYYLGSGSGALSAVGVTDSGGIYQRVAVGLTPTSITIDKSPAIAVS